MKNACFIIGCLLCGRYSSQDECYRLYILAVDTVYTVKYPIPFPVLDEWLDEVCLVEVLISDIQLKSDIASLKQSPVYDPLFIAKDVIVYGSAA